MQAACLAVELLLHLLFGQQDFPCIGLKCCHAMVDSAGAASRFASSGSQDVSSPSRTGKLASHGITPHSDKAVTHKQIRGAP